MLIVIVECVHCLVMEMNNKTSLWRYSVVPLDFWSCTVKCLWCDSSC